MSFIKNKENIERQLHKNPQTYSYNTKSTYPFRSPKFTEKTNIF